jgi:hypothetical protein
MDGSGRCALAAAADAVGIPPIVVEERNQSLVDYSSLQALWPMLDGVFQSPTSGYADSAIHIIWELNDCRGWTREQIADWVEQIEREQQAPAEEQMTCRNT